MIDQEIQLLLDEKQDEILTGMPVPRDGKVGDIRTNIFHGGKAYSMMKVGVGDDAWRYSAPYSRVPSIHTMDDYLLKSAANYVTLTDNSMADALHRHSELSASDGSPDPALQVSAAGRVSISYDLIVDSDLLFVDVAPGRVGIGTSSPASLLHINSAVAANITLLTLESDINNANEYNEILFKIAGGLNYGAIRSHVGGAGDSYMTFATTTNAGTLVQHMTIQHDGKVGFGTKNPGRQVEIYAANPQLRLRDSGPTASSGGAFIEFGGTDASSWVRTGYVGDGASANTDIYLVAEQSNLILTAATDIILTPGGTGVGIGTNTPLGILHTVGTGHANPILSNAPLFFDDRAYNVANAGGIIMFGGKYNSGGDTTVFAGIKGAKANTVDGDYDGRLEFYTRKHGNSVWTTAQRMVIDEDGNVGIGIATPLAKLHIDQATDDAAIPVLILDQADISDGFINFIGSDRGAITGATDSLKSVRVELGGVVHRLALYVDA